MAGERLCRSKIKNVKKYGKGGIRTPGRALQPYSGLANRRPKPARRPFHLRQGFGGHGPLILSKQRTSFSWVLPSEALKSEGWATFPAWQKATLFYYK